MKSYIPLLCLLFLFFSNCSKDDELQMVSTIVDTPTINISVSAYEDHLTFRVEVLQDSIDQRAESGFNSDFCTIAFDVNQNGDKDINVDFGFGSPTSNYDICAFYFLEDPAISPCGAYESEATFTGAFEGSDLNASPHIIWELDVPKKEFSNANAVDFIVKIYQPNQYSTAPRNNIFANSGLFSFEQVLTVEW